MRSPPALRAHAPHLAVLDIVDYALDTAVWALMDDFPALRGDPHPWHPTPPDHLAAQRLLRQIRTFAHALDRYRRALATPPESPPPSPADDDIDF